MADQRYDIVVFGATGFTGQFVVEEIARIAEETKVTWAVAGRNMERMQKVLSTASRKTGKDLESIPIIIADTSNEESLKEMCQKAQVVLNCVGPYRFHGEMMVRAAIEGGASHIDISGEPQYLETMQLKYHAKAKESGVYVIGSCGFDSIPADMGVVYTTNNFPGTVNSIECYIDVISGSEGFTLNTGTLESAIHGLLHMGEMRTLRKSLYTTSLPPYKYRCKSRGNAFKSEVNGKYCFEFQGSDRSVVYRTQRYKHDVLNQRPVQFMPYFCRDGFMGVVGMVIFGILFFIMTKFSLGRSLLMKYPSFFTFGVFKKNGPSKKQIEDTSFTMTFVAKGWGTKLENPEEEPESEPDTVMMTRVTGPEPGYVATPICMVQSALVLLKEKSKLPQDGGVYTPATAFMKTSLIDRLHENNVLFQEVK